MDDYALFLLAAIGAFLFAISQWLKRQKSTGIAVAGQLLEIVGGACTLAGLALLALKGLFPLLL